jgi:CBS domain-containing protein
MVRAVNGASAVLLSAWLGKKVRTVSGRVVGRLVDLTVSEAGEHPRVQRLALGRGRRIDHLLAWEVVSSWGPDGIVIADGAEPRGLAPEATELAPDELRLARDVLDTQIVDVSGKRLARVADVVLVPGDGAPRVVAVDVGASAVLSRLGMRRVAARFDTASVDWQDLHLTSRRGHALALGTTTTGVHRLGASELATVVAHLPAERAAEVLHAVAPAQAAGALAASHPVLGARLLRALPGGSAGAVVEQMRHDDAAAMLRRLSSAELDRVLAEVGSERGAVLRRLVSHRVDRAGGLMNPSVLTARRDESTEAVRARVEAWLEDRDVVTSTGPRVPELDSLATVFVLDDDGRPIGVLTPTDLLAGRSDPVVVPVLPVDLPVDRVVDLFALHDVLALPVVDHDGRLVGAVAVDDVLEELLAERLPGRRRFGRVRRHPADWRSHRRPVAGR